MTTPFSTIEQTDLLQSPDIVEQFSHWMQLLGLNFTISRDKRDGAYIIFLIYTNAPDLFLEFDYRGRNLTFYSNILTEFDPENLQNSQFFFIFDVLNKQSLYQTVRICAAQSSTTKYHVIKLFSKYKTSQLFNMQIISDIIRDAENFLITIQQLIVEHNLPEVWREMEGEPNTDKYNLNFHFDYH